VSLPPRLCRAGETPLTRNPQVPVKVYGLLNRLFELRVLKYTATTLERRLEACAELDRRQKEFKTALKTANMERRRYGLSHVRSAPVPRWCSAANAPVPRLLPTCWRSASPSSRSSASFAATSELFMTFFVNL
jgi:hypothetical protein